jgi:hypothetical protein
MAMLNNQRVFYVILSGFVSSTIFHYCLTTCVPGSLQLILLLSHTDPMSDALSMQNQNSRLWHYLQVREEVLFQQVPTCSNNSTLACRFSEMRLMTALTGSSSSTPRSVKSIKSSYRGYIIKHPIHIQFSSVNH